MPNEIYHRSNWGESKAEGFGDVYYDHAATNKLYNHSDYYENSDGTDATLKDLNNKASIVLTPTAYSDGSLNTVIPPYAPSYILNLPYVTSEWSFSESEGWSIDETNNKIVAEATWTGINKSCSYAGLGNVGKTVRVSFDAVVTAGSFHLYRPFSSGDISESGSYSFTATSQGSLLRFRNRSTDFAGEISNVKYEVIEEADFDFSRGSSATRVNEQGLVEDVQILSGELVQNGNFEQIGSELVTNGNFDDGLNGWSSHSDSILELEDGKAKVTSANNSGWIKRNDLSIQSGKIYFCTAEITNALSPKFFINNTANQLSPIPLISGNTYGGYITTTGTNSTFFIRGNNVNGQVSFIDNVSVKEVGQNWTPNTNATLSIDNGRLKVAISGGSGYPSQNITTVVGKKYKITADAFIGTATKVSLYSAAFGFNDLTADGSYNLIFTATSTSTQIRLYVYGDGTYGFWDNISLIEITDDTDLPRIDYTDGTGSLLLEKQRTNKITYSEDFSDSSWNKAAVSLDSGYLAPDGTNTAFKVTGTTGNLYFGGVLANDSRSIWAKTVSGTGQAHLCSYFGNTNNTFTITNEWQRFIVNGTTTSTGAGNFYAIDFRGDTDLSEIILWGAQCEVGDYATSYIPTSGSTVTRSSDVANNSGNADLINSTEGVLYAEIAALSNTSDSSKFISISDGTYNNRASILFSNGSTNQIRTFLRVGGVSQIDVSDNVADVTDFNKVAFSYKENNFKVYINGSLVSTDASGSVWTSGTITKLSLSEISTSAGLFNGNVKSVAVFKEALSNDLLERLTGEGYESFRLLAEANNYTII